MKLSHLSEFFATDAEQPYHPQEIPRKLVFVFTLCKFQSQDLLFNLLGWTGFNTLLAKDVPTESKINYLPIIDNPITEMSTINQVLRQSVQIADVLELPRVFLLLMRLFMQRYNKFDGRMMFTIRDVLCALENSM